MANHPYDPDAVQNGPPRPQAPRLASRVVAVTLLAALLAVAYQYAATALQSGAHLAIP